MSADQQSELRLSTAHLTAIREHAIKTYPEECCGIMIGHIDRASSATEVRRLLAADNTREDTARHNRYLIEPRMILEAQRSADREGTIIVGYYHSHPDHPSQPSDFDREYAWPDLSYLIVSVCEGHVVDERSWRLRDDRTAFVQEDISSDSPLDASSATRRQAP